MKIQAARLDDLTPAAVAAALVKVRAMIRDRQVQMATKEDDELRAAGFRFAAERSRGRRLAISPYGHTYVETQPGVWAYMPIARAVVATNGGDPGRDPVGSSESMGRSKDTWMGRSPLTPSRKVIPDNEPKRVHKPFPERAMKPIGWSQW